jgi:hypothetical protein
MDQILRVKRPIELFRLGRTLVGDTVIWRRAPSIVFNVGHCDFVWRISSSVQ